MNENPEQAPTSPAPPYQVMMVPVMIPTPQRPQVEEKKESDTPNVIAGMFWAVVILLAMWFITSGWEAMQ